MRRQIGIKIMTVNQQDLLNVLSAVGRIREVCAATKDGLPEEKPEKVGVSIEQ